MRYRTLFSIRLFHEYYRDGISPELVLAPAPGTLEKLRDHRARIVERPGSISIAFPLNEAGDASLVPFGPDDKLEFFLVVNGSFFSAVTRLDAGLDFRRILGRQAFLHYRNTALMAGSHTMEAGMIEPTHTDYHRVAERAPAEAFFLQKPALPGLDHTSFVISGLNAVTAPSAYEAGRKRLLINTSDAELGTRFSITYRYAPDWPFNAYGLVECTDLQDMNWESNFEIRFTALETQWRYYVINKTEDQDPTINISAVEASPAVTFTPTPVPQTGITDALDQKIRDLFADGSIMRFEAQAPQPYREVPHRLRLTKSREIHDDSNGTDTELEILYTIESLPNPSPLEGGIKIINLIT